MHNMLTDMTKGDETESEFVDLFAIRFAVQSELFQILLFFFFFLLTALSNLQQQGYGLEYSGISL